MELSDYIKNESSKSSVYDYFAGERLGWEKKIAALTDKMKNLNTLPDLQGSIYTDRQTATETVAYVQSLLISENKKYNRKYSERYDFYTFGSDKRYPTDTAKKDKIKVDMEDMEEIRMLLNSHLVFMKETVTTIDNMIYGISNRIKFEEITRGGK